MYNIPDGCTQIKVKKIASNGENSFDFTWGLLGCKNGCKMGIIGYYLGYIGLHPNIPKVKEGPKEGRGMAENIFARVHFSA